MSNSTAALEQVGLSHLMEAATALAGLTASVTPAPCSTVPAESQVSTGPFLEKPTMAAAEGIPCTNKAGIQSAASSANALDLANSKEIFPARLMAILSDPSLSEIVTWLPHGRSFVVLRPDVFTEQVLPKYVPAVDSRASTKYPSFTRKVNRWYVFRKSA